MWKSDQMTIGKTHPNLFEKPWKESVFKPKGPKVEFIKTIELNEKYHFVSDNDFEMKMISGEKVRFDQNVPEKNIVTLPNRNERFKLEWQQVH